MRRPERSSRAPAAPPPRAVVIALAITVAFGCTQPATALDRRADSGGALDQSAETGESWIWPVEAPFRVSRPYLAPAHEFGPGHRGIDLEPQGDAVVRAPAGGIVAFAGDVAGRGILTIDHGSGLVTTLEPVTSDLLPGVAVTRGEEVGLVTLGGHAVTGQVHFGVRLDGAYINPLLLLGGVPRAVLLPCCE